MHWKHCLSFLAASLTPAVASAQIVLTAPNGGERLMEGSPYVIRWTVSGAPGNVQLILRQGTTRYGDIAINVPGATGSYAWTVGACVGGRAPVGTGYSIRIRAIGGPVLDDSDAPFSIIAGMRAVGPEVSSLAQVIRTLEVPALQQTAIRHSIKETSWNCLHSMGRAPIVPPAGEMLVGYENYYDDRGAMCAEQWSVTVYRAVVVSPWFELRTLAGKTIDEASLVMRHQRLENNRPGVVSAVNTLAELTSTYRGDYEGMTMTGGIGVVARGVGEEYRLPVTEIFRHWVADPAHAYGIAFRGRNERMQHNNEHCYSALANARWVVRYH